MWWMIIPVLVVAAAGAWMMFLILARPSQTSIERFETKFTPPGSGGDTGIRSAQSELREDMLIVIPDISGYTKFMTRSRFALSHAHFVISQLLSSIIEAGSQTLKPMRLEGDAVVFHADAATLDPQEVGHTVEEIFRAFYRRLEKLKHENICRCEVCDHLAGLELKIIIHHGDVIKYQMGTLEDVTGNAMIVIHRLLKNKIGMARYVLVTESASGLVNLPGSWPQESATQDMDGMDAVAFKVFKFNRSDLPADRPPEQTGTAWGKAKDLALKVLAPFLGRYRAYKMQARRKGEWAFLFILIHCGWERQGRSPSVPRL